MNQDLSNGGQDALAEAQRTIAAQAAEIEQLRRRLADERFAEELRDALAIAAAAGTIAAPVSHSRLLEMIVDTAADVINAKAASLFLIDEEAQELVFEVALGEKAEEVKKFRVPLGHGIAGLVALTGQPMAVADSEDDPRQAADIAQSIGYTPQSILCVPLFYGDRTIGVLELLDKENDATFSAVDMEALGLFANQAAVAIEQSRTSQNLAGLVSTVVQSIGSIPEYQRQSLLERSRAFATDIEADATYRRAVELAELVQEIVQQGDSETNACRTILEGFAEYLRARSRPMTDFGMGMLR